MKRPVGTRKNKRMFNQNSPFGQYPPNNPYSPNDPYNPNNSYPQPGFVSPVGPYSRVNRKRRTGCMGCFLVLLVFIGICFGVIFIVAKIQSQPPAIFYQGDLPFNTIDLIIGAVVVILILVLLSRVARMIGGKSLGNRVSGLFVIFGVVAISIGLFWHVFVNPNISMTSTGFLRTTAVDINDGDTIHFRNPANGVTQILCIGVDQHCQPKSGDPSQLDSGLIVQPGQTVSVAFDTDGMYQITSKTTPNMNITINVTTSDSGDSGD